MRRRALTLAVLAAVTLGAAVTQALATTNMAVEATDNVFFAGGSVDEGLQAVFENQGSNTHNVTAEARGPDGKDLFRTGNTPGQQMRAVSGTEYLSAGSYPYVCTLHPGMDGDFVVVDMRGTDPVPRPNISLKLKSKKLAKVVNSGKLKVKVKAKEPTQAENIKLKAKKGKKGISKGKSLNLAAGAAKTVKLKLSDKGLDKLAGSDSAKVKVSGTVDFGFGDKASKKLK